MVADAIHDLNAAVDAARKHDREAALSEMLKAWRITAYPTLGDRIDELSDALIQNAPLYGPETQREARVLAWNGVAKAPTSLDIGRLAATLHDGVRASDVELRVRAFASFGADPRIASAYLRLIADPPWTAGSNRRLWTEIFSQLATQHRDPRVVLALNELVDRYLDLFGHTSMGNWMQKALGKLESNLKAFFRSQPFELSPDAKAKLDEITIPLGLGNRIAVVRARPPATEISAPTSDARDSADAWLAYIAEDPDDDGRIDAFATWLRDQQDARAEFIEIQMRRHRGQPVSLEDEKNERELFAAHASEWLGPMVHAVSAGLEGFERGVLTRCSLAPKGKFAPLAVGHPSWATVRNIDGGWKNKDVAYLVKQPILRSLRSLNHVSSALFDFFARDTSPRKIEEIHLDNGPHPDDIDAAFDAPGLPHLRHLSIGIFSPARLRGKKEHNWLPPERYAPFFSCPMVSRLEKLDIDVHPHYLSDWIDAIQKTVPETVNATIGLGHGSTLRRASSGKYSHLESVFDASNLFWVVETLDGIDGRLLSRFELSWRGRVDDSADLRKRCMARINTFREQGVDVVVPTFDP